jgi:uncharacterized protein YjeT (DUF2065 family)
MITEESAKLTLGFLQLFGGISVLLGSIVVYLNKKPRKAKRRK